MSRLTECFVALRREKRKALIPFITAGDPTPAMTQPIMHALVKAGANIIELGMPFSDPMADGPVIQRASERALIAGTQLKDVLAIVKDFRSKNKKTPIVLMGYLNPIEVMGYEKFAKNAQAVGVDGVLIVDLPPEESTELSEILDKYHIDLIFLLAPTSTPERIEKIAEKASGYLYYVSLKGVTGSGNLNVKAVKDKLIEIREYTDLPIGVGFGIRDAESAAKIAKISDAVIVGSALVQRVEKVEHDKLAKNLSNFLKKLRKAMDDATN